MRVLLISAALMLSACHSTYSNPLLANDWTNGRQPCSDTNLSFKNGRIGYYPKDGQVPLFDIVWMKPIADDPEWMVVHVKPAKELQANIASKGLSWPSASQPTFLFRVHERRLSLMAMSRNAAERMHVPTVEQARTFDLVACPASTA